MSELPEQVARNRQGVRRANSQFYEVPQRQRGNLRFLRNTISVSLTSETVEERPVNDSLISGHPDGGTHGSGRGVSGDQRGEWQTAAADADAEQWLRAGRNNVRDTLAGETAGQLRNIVVGSAPFALDLTDTSLVAREGATKAWGARPATGQFTFTGEFRSTDLGSISLEEFGMETRGGTLVSRYTLDSLSGNTVSTDLAHEYRVTLAHEVVGSGTGSSRFTDAGLAMVADSLLPDGTAQGIEKVAWGVGTPDQSAPALGGKVYEKRASYTKGREQLRVTAAQFQNEPSGQPYDYSEVALLNESGEIVWISGFLTDTFTKDAETEFATVVGFRLR